MKHYRQLTQEERYQISALRELGYSNSKIAERLGRSASTINREIRRNGGAKGYDASNAQRASDQRRRSAKKYHKRLPTLVEWVESLIRQDWSPEQVAGFARKLGRPLVSHEWIYRHIERDKARDGDLYLHLRHKKKRYRKRYGGKDNRGRIVNRVGIEHRPAVVDRRNRLGDWEGDTIVGKGRSALVTIVERKTGQTMIRKVTRATAKLTAEAIIDALCPFPELVKTITLDNGKEFAAHEQFAEALACKVYFARPYHSWERGTNENTNGLIRQYFPKGTDFDSVTNEEIEVVERKLNERPRKRLGYEAPVTLFGRAAERMKSA